MRWLQPSKTIDVFLAELQILALLIGKVLPEKRITFALVAGLLSHMKQHLWVSLRMDNMTLGQILTKAQAIMLDTKESVIVAIRLVQSSTNQTLPSLFVWVLWHINLCRLFNTKPIFIQINSSISNTSV